MPEIDDQALLDFTRRLLRVRSVHEPETGGSEQAVAAIVVEQMRAFGWEPLVEEAAAGRPNVIATLDGGRPGPTLLFEGHVDVVTEGDRDAWSHDPYGAEVVDGKLYARGAADMKGGVAAMLFAADLLAREGFAGRIVVGALVDEEGMMLGVRDFCRRGHAAGLDAALICEPEGYEVCVAQKGALRLRAEVPGRMAHGAMPQHGKDPIPPLADWVRAVGDTQAAVQRERGEHRHLGWDYLTPTWLEAGSEVQFNVIPGLASAGIDVRTTPGLDHGALVERLRRALPPGATLHVIDDRPATETPDDHPLARAALAAHQEVLGRPSRLGGVPGATDGTILVKDAGVPIVTCGPGGKWIAHQVDEYVEVAELLAYGRIFADTARRYLAGPER
ncbi:MAG: M20 family metallopeptidase [Candidatus Dormibacteraceae bacterium]